MATLAEIGRGRRADLRRLLKASRSLDAAQESLEREVKRLTTRKNKVPETDDAVRITGMVDEVQTALNNMASTIAAIASNWTTI